MDWNTLDFEKAANAILILIVGLGGFFGLNQARKKGNAAGSQETMELAGAVINGKDAKMLADSFDKVSANAAALQLEMAEHRKSLDRNSDVTGHMNDEMRNLANAMLISRK